MKSRWEAAIRARRRSRPGSAGPGKKASAGTFGEAAAFGEMAVLATHWAGTENAVRLAGPENLAGKVVIDATNPLLFRPKALPELAVGGERLGAQSRSSAGCPRRRSSRRSTPSTTPT